MESGKEMLALFCLVKYLCLLLTFVVVVKFSGFGGLNQSPKVLNGKSHPICLLYFQCNFVWVGP